MYLKKGYVSLFVILLGLISFALAGVFQDSSYIEFSQGNFYRTFYNSSGFIQLNISENFDYGNFSSRIFDAGTNSIWKNISWFSEVCYGCELPNGSLLEQGNFLRLVNMTGNILLAHFDELSGNVTDYSGYNNKGIVKTSGTGAFEGPEYGAIGKFSKGFDFETGSGSNGEFVNFTNPPQFNNLGNQITLEAWINPESFSTPLQFDSPTFMDKGPNLLSFYISSGASNQLRFILDTSSGSATDYAGTTNLITNQWYHAVATYNGSQVKIYLNGNLESSFSRTGTISNNNLDLIIGSGWSGSNPNSFPFDGKIDEVAMYNRSLESNEIKDHYLRGILKLNLSIRSCDDSLCIGEPFSLVSGNSPQNLSIVENNYFQYMTEFTTEDTNYTPRLFNVSTDYLVANSAPSVNLTYPLNNTNYSVLQTILNYTVLDTDLQACWYTTNFGSVNNTISCGLNVTGLSSSQGSNIWTIYANDSGGNEKSSSSIFFVDTLAPIISIMSPSNNSLLTNNTIFVNYTAIDNGIGLQTCWWTNSSGVRNTTVPCGTNFSFVGEDGNNFVSVYANDSLGNINYAVHTLRVNTQAPTVNILYPIGGAVVGNITNIDLNYSVSDLNLDACWFTVTDGFLNLTLVNCANSSFNVSSSGIYDLKVYANDSLGNLGLDEVTFSVSVDGPSITPINPIDRYLNLANSQNVSFTYLPYDLNLQSCNLWTDINGAYSLNATHLNANSGQQNSFYLNLSMLNEGNYLWAVQCNDSLGYESMTGNQTFYIDRTTPLANIANPSGIFNSLTNIPISVIYSDTSPVQCFYNVTFAATGNLVIGNSEIMSCADTTFTVDTESSYFFILAVNDSAGNINISRKTFTVSIPVSGGSGGGSSSGGSGGSGGGSGFSALPSFKINIENLESLVIGRGESESVEIKVSNAGFKFLNNCKAETNGGIADWISVREVKSLSPGQTENYVLSVNIPLDAELGDYFATINLICDEASSSISYNVKVSGGEFELNVLSSERIGTKLRVNYVLENFADIPKDLTITYQLMDEDVILTEGIGEKLSLGSKSKIETKIEFELPKNSIGDFELIMKVTDGVQTQIYEQAVRLTAGSIGGFAISDSNLKAISWFGILVLFGFGIFIIVKMLRKEIIRRRRIAIPERQFINIDLDN